MAQFSLIDEPWMNVRMLDGRRRIIGLREAFVRAHEIADIVDDMSPAVISIHRLLLAIVYRAAGPENLAGWTALWRRGIFDGRMSEYLERMRGRFDLFHSERPFFQTRGVESAKTASILKLSYINENSSASFRQDSWEDPKPVDPARCARLLLTTQYFGRTGMHAKLPGEENSAYSGPLTDIVSVLVTGQNLFETLVLNTPPTDFLATIFGASGMETDSPWWERDEPIGPDVRSASGYLDLLTRPSRRILLFPEMAGGSFAVRKVALLLGVEFPTDETRPLRETMAPYRIVETKKKKGTEKETFSFRWRSDMLAWQNSCALFRAFDSIPKNEDGSGEAVVVRHHPSRTVEWLSLAAQAGVIERTRPFRVAVFGTDGNKGSIDFWKQETLPLRPVYLSDPALFEAVRGAVDAAQGARGILYWSIRKGVHNVYDFGIRDEKKPGTSAKRISEFLAEGCRGFMASLERPFQRYLENLVDRPAGAILDSWRRRVAVAVRAQAHATLDRLGSDVRASMIRGSVDRCIRGGIRKFLSKEESNVVAQ